MNPDIFLEPGEELISLARALLRYSQAVQDADARMDALKSAGIDDLSFLSDLKCSASPMVFGNKLITKFKDFPISMRQPHYHPMVKWLEYLMQLPPYPFTDQELGLFERLINRGHENFMAWTARCAVCRIESPQEHPIGTGVLIENGYVLTCDHIFNTSRDQPIWVRFGYKIGHYGAEKGEVFLLDVEAAPFHRRLDYALAKIQGKLKFPPAIMKQDGDENDEIRLIHHPQGLPAQISTVGHIIRKGSDYIDHDLPSHHGSSGAPIYNQQWQVIAIHRGYPGPGRPVIAGTYEAIPVSSIWHEISPIILSV